MDKNPYPYGTVLMIDADWAMQSGRDHDMTQRVMWLGVKTGWPDAYASIFLVHSEGVTGALTHLNLSAWTPVDET